MAGSISDASRLRAEGMADSDPVAANDSEDNRRKNRRVMVILRVQG
jgi:type VI secretion system protein ImpK